MDTLTIIEETATTPRFELNNENGSIVLKGRSIPTDPTLFYTPIINQIDKYLEFPARKTIATIMVDYLNTPSDKFVLRILRKLEAFFNSGNDVLITWCYEEGDEDMQKTGEYYKSILAIPFQFKELKET